jgi:deoxyribodipyrimidine photo-lyase
MPITTLVWFRVAGCGADAAPYFRIFNPTAQATRFDPQGTYVREWVPELALLPSEWIHQPWVVDHETARTEAPETLATLKK